MTKDEILSIPVGRELDALVAEKVMNIHQEVPTREVSKTLGVFRGVEHPLAMWRDDRGYWFLDGLPYYSTKIAAAWEVVEELHECGYWLQLRSPFGTGEANDGYWAGFTPHLMTGWNGWLGNWIQAQTAPIAICRAALLAVMGVEK